MNSYRRVRGKKAPYKTMMIRIPVPLKPLVELLDRQFCRFVAINKMDERECSQFTRDIISASTGQPPDDASKKADE